MIDPHDPGTLCLIEACAAPKTNAQRQRELRARRKKLKEETGAKSILLSHEERCVLSLGLLAHEDLFHRPADWESSKKPGFDALLDKLWPEGDKGRYLAEPERSTRRPAAFLRDQLEREREEKKRLQEALYEIAAEVGVPGAVVAPHDSAAQRLAALEKENQLLESERNGALAALKVYVARLEKAGLGTDYRRQPGE